MFKRINIKKALYAPLKSSNISNTKIVLDTGPEIIAGSTRLKAGTAQKICLNTISTLVMTKLGRSKNGMMTMLDPKSKKLRIRQKNINLKVKG